MAGLTSSQGRAILDVEFESQLCGSSTESSMTRWLAEVILHEAMHVCGRTMGATVSDNYPKDACSAEVLLGRVVFDEVILSYGVAAVCSAFSLLRHSD